MNDDLKYVTDILQSDHLLIEGYGLLHGKMGAALLFYELANIDSEQGCHEYAEQFLEECLVKLPYLPWSFEEGVLGIGWGIHCLIDKHWVEGDADEVLFDIDSGYFRFFFESERSYDKWLGAALYFQRRIIEEPMSRSGLYQSILKQHVIYVIDDAAYWFTEKMEQEEFVLRELQKKSFENQLLKGLWGLAELHQLNIFNYKIEKILEEVLERVVREMQSLCRENSIFLVLLVKELQQLSFENFDLQPILQRLRCQLSVVNRVVVEDPFQERIFLALLGREVGVEVVLGENVQRDVDRLRKERKYGLSDGIIGLGLCLCSYEKKF